MDYKFIQFYPIFLVDFYQSGLSVQLKDFHHSLYGKELYYSHFLRDIIHLQS